MGAVAERVQRATLTRYTAWLEREHGLRFDDYARLWEWSVSDLDAFWASIVEFFEVRFSSGRPTSSWGSARCRARSGFPAPGSRSPSTSSAGKDDERARDPHASELRAAGLLDVG